MDWVVLQDDKLFSYKRRGFRTGGNNHGHITKITKTKGKERKKLKSESGGQYQMIKLCEKVLYTRRRYCTGYNDVLRVLCLVNSMIG